MTECFKCGSPAEMLIEEARCAGCNSTSRMGLHYSGSLIPCPVGVCRECLRNYPGHHPGLLGATCPDPTAVLFVLAPLGALPEIVVADMPLRVQRTGVQRLEWREEE